MSKVNIVVPVYGVEKYLPQFLDSLLAQTFTDYTAFVVNDCTRDGSWDIVRSYEERFGGRLVLLENEENMGQGPTRNRGLEEAEKRPCTYVTFLDSDDFVEPDFLESMVTLADRDGADLVVCGMRRFEDETGAEMAIEAVNGPDGLVTDVAGFDELAYINTAPYNKLYRAGKVRGVRFHKMRRSEDTCYLFEVLPEITSVEFTNRVSYHYRVRGNSVTTAFDFGICESMFEGFGSLYGRYLTEEKFAPFRELFEAQVFIRSAVGGVFRAAMADRPNSGGYIRRTKEWMDEAMPHWRRNEYLSLCGHRSANIKQFALKGSALLYKMNLFTLFIAVYATFQKVTGKDVRM